MKSAITNYWCARCPQNSHACAVICTANHVKTYVIDSAYFYDMMSRCKIELLIWSYDGAFKSLVTYFCFCFTYIVKLSTISKTYVNYKLFRFHRIGDTYVSLLHITIRMQYAA